MIVVSEHCEFIHMTRGTQLNSSPASIPVACTSGTICKETPSWIFGQAGAIDAAFPRPLRCGPCEPFGDTTRITSTAYRPGRFARERMSE